ncbi:MAG: methylated-DNA--[protein]-cysteine S-methyltransferase [Steroidobacteraceae bacterium]
MIYWHEMESPVGPLLLAGDGSRIKVIHFRTGPHARRPGHDWVADRLSFEAAIAQLEEYFAGQRQSFDLPLAPEGTDFQRTVWQALTRIPYGETISYGELARRIGKPQASRAVGLANGANPLPIVIPCHRVIGADGSLTGFGGGLDIKRKLLALEREVSLRESSARAESRRAEAQLELLG